MIGELSQEESHKLRMIEYVLISVSVHHILFFLQSHSSVEKAGLVGLVRMRLLPCDENLSLRGETVKDAIEADKKLGLIPFYVST